MLSLLKGRASLMSGMVFLWGLLGLGLQFLAVQPAFSDTCTLEELTKTADEVGASLRRYNNDTMPKVQAKMQQLRLKKGWSPAKYRELAADYLHDSRIAGFDEKANELYLKIDQLSPRENDKKIECSRVSALRAAGLELLAVMKAKSAHTLSKIDQELKPKTKLFAKSTRSNKSQEQQALASKGQPQGVAKPSRAREFAVKSPLKAPSVSTEDDVAVLAPERTPGAWQTDTFRDENAPGPTKSYSIEEIRNATRGFFGTISTNLASVLEYAFKNLGRPTAYVLGNEGGGAFLAGLRYGKGTLYMREGGTRRVYWHGPSFGYDFGASGSRTMFLIYKLDKPEKLFRSYTGIDGSAYLVGGVGITFLKGGSVLMAPIRSGIGLRIGANLGYIRFSPTATWNPF